MLEELQAIHEKQIEDLKLKNRTALADLMKAQAEEVVKAENPEPEVPEEPEVVITYYKCSECGMVTSSEAWIENEFPYKGEVGFQVCPMCEAVNAEIISDQENPHLPEVWFATNKIIVAPFTKADLDELDAVKKELKVLKKSEEKLMPKIKPFLVENEITEFNYAGHKMVMAYQNRGAMNEEMLLAVIDAKIEAKRKEIEECVSEVDLVKLEDDLADLEYAVMIERKTNPDRVKVILAKGFITLTEIQPCMTQNIVPVFYLNAKPRKEKVATDGFGGMF